MAVVQISQIQIRRGFLQDLGHLAGGEFGWAVDKLRLFIGNGPTTDGAPYEGNTELLTTNSDLLALLGNYSYKGLLGGYQVSTGISGLAPILRTFQNKVDDFVNIRDFGALGDGLNDDTDAIQRAINEIYGRRAPFTPIITRRTINFHPGVYHVSRDLILPPYCSFRNSGKDSVIIKQIGISANCVIRTSDPTGNWQSLTEFSKLGPIEVSGITFQTDVASIPVLILESASDVSFYRCKLLGYQSNSTLTTPNSSRIVSLSANYVAAKNIYFTECDLANASTLVEIANTTSVNNIHFDKSTFSHAYTGITANSSSKITAGIRVTNSLFSNIATQAINTQSTIDGTVSAFNTFVNVGHNHAVHAAPITPVIEFKGNINYSFADIFTRSEEHSESMPNVKHYNNLNVSTDSSSAIRLGNSYQTVGKTRLINDASTNYIPLPVNFKQGFVEYSVERGNTVRSGKLNYVINNQSFEFHDAYTEIGQTGITLEPVYQSTKPYLLCTTDISGYQSAFTYTVKSLSNIN